MFYSRFKSNFKTKTTGGAKEFSAIEPPVNRPASFAAALPSQSGEGMTNARMKDLAPSTVLLAVGSVAKPIKISKLAVVVIASNPKADHAIKSVAKVEKIVSDVAFFPTGTTVTIVNQQAAEKTKSKKLNL